MTATESVAADDPRTEPKAPSVADVISRYRGRYFAQQLAAGMEVDRQVRSVLTVISLCRTGTLGCHEFRCSSCDQRSVRMNSCGNRHCPRCSGPGRRRWVERVLAWRLPCEYLHTVFTLPHHSLDGRLETGGRRLHAS